MKILHHGGCSELDRRPDVQKKDLPGVPDGAHVCVILTYISSHQFKPPNVGENIPYMEHLGVILYPNDVSPTQDGCHHWN